MNQGSLLNGLLRREWQLALRKHGEYLLPLAFFALTATCFPLSLGPEPQLLAQIAPAAIWIAALLASLLSVDTLFRRDFEDGTLELLLLYAEPLFLAVLVKIAVHWLATCIPLLLVTPLLGLALHLQASVLPALLMGLLLGTAIFSLVGAIGAALTVTIRRGSLLIGLLLLPLFASVLILGMIAADSASGGMDPTAALLWLATLLTLALTLAPFAAGAALRATLFP